MPETTIKHRLPFAFRSLVISERMKCKHDNCGVVYNYFTGDWESTHKKKRTKKSK